MALSLSGLLLTRQEAPELREELARAVSTPVLRLQLCAGEARCGDVEMWEEPWQRQGDQTWVPVSGSWVWWIDQTLVILCEEVGAQIFATARNWFYEAAGVQQQPMPEFVWAAAKKHIERIFPNIFYADLFRYKKYSVIGIGRDLEHRKRAGCLGLAAQICNDQRKDSRPHLTKAQELVLDEISSKSGWLPWEPIERFYDMDKQGFWQNIEIWREVQGQKHPPLSTTVLSDIRMNCQPAFLRELQQNPWVEIDLTHSTRPWRGLLKGHKELKAISGSHGIERFKIVADRTKLDPYQEVPLVYFEVVAADGRQHTFHTLDRTDAWILTRFLGGGWAVTKTCGFSRFG